MSRLYALIIAPTGNFLIRWMARACLLGGLVILLAIAAGWTSP